MAQGTVNAWETLFLRALCVLESVPLEFGWSFGGGTVLMRRYGHRLSKDIDIFLADPQLLGYLSPRLNPAAEALTPDYVEQANFVKLYFPEGEVDFVASAPLTPDPAAREAVLGRTVLVESGVWTNARMRFGRTSRPSRCSDTGRASRSACERCSTRSRSPPAGRLGPSSRPRPIESLAGSE